MPCHGLWTNFPKEELPLRSLQILLLLLGVGLLTSSAEASVVYSDSTDFITSLEPGFGYENFNGLGTGTRGSSMDLGDLTVSATSNLYVALGIMSTAVTNAALTIGEFETPINAFGAYIWNTNVSLSSLTGDIDVLVTYADATTDVFSISPATSDTFWGISSTKSLSALTFTSSGGPWFRGPYVTMDNALYGTIIPASPVPEPATISLMALAGLGGLALRKRNLRPSRVAQSLN